MGQRPDPSPFKWIFYGVLKLRLNFHNPRAIKWDWTVKNKFFTMTGSHISVHPIFYSDLHKKAGIWQNSTVEIYIFSYNKYIKWKTWLQASETMRTCVWTRFQIQVPISVSLIGKALNFLTIRTTVGYKYSRSLWLSTKRRQSRF